MSQRGRRVSRLPQTSKVGICPLSLSCFPFFRKSSHFCFPFACRRIASAGVFCFRFYDVFMALFLLKGFSFCDCLPTAAEVMRSAFVSPPTMVWGAFLRNCSHEFSPFTLVWRNYLAFDTLFPSLLYGGIFTVDVTLKFSCRCEPVRFPLLYG